MLLKLPGKDKGRIVRVLSRIFHERLLIGNTHKENSVLLCEQVLLFSGIVEIIQCLGHYLTI